jgi:hypothetical protein
MGQQANNRCRSPVGQSPNMNGASCSWFGIQDVGTVGFVAGLLSFLRRCSMYCYESSLLK